MVSQARAADAATSGRSVAASRPFRASTIVGASQNPSRASQRTRAGEYPGSENSRHDRVKTNNTGLPTSLKEGAEALSGVSLDDVRVHRASTKPAALNARAYARGSDIYLASGAERHLPHEAWHVVQQKQGRVPADGNVGGVLVSNDPRLEREAEVLGARASSMVVPTSRGDTVVADRKGATSAPVGGSNGTAGIAQLVGETKYVIQVRDDALPQDVSVLTKALASRKAEVTRVKTNALRITRWARADILTTHEEEKGRVEADLSLSSDERLSKLVSAMDARHRGMKTLLLDDYAGSLREKTDIRAYLDTAGIRIDGSNVYVGETAVATLRPLAEALVPVGSVGAVHQGRDGKAEEDIVPSSATLPPENGRPLFKRPDSSIWGGPGEYVLDDRGHPTRRYAFVEKNYYQVMDFLQDKLMTGRYQTISAETERLSAKAFSKQPTRIFRPPGQELRKMMSKGTDERLSPTELAVFHQWQGSGVNQRGVSLTSTPKEDAVWANEGDSFRSKSGVRLKVDLSRVPKNVALINHYAPGIEMLRRDGIKEDFVVPGKTYDYPGSVTKNREIYLERVEPQWIVEGWYHRGEDATSDERISGGEAMMDELRTLTAEAEYRKGEALGRKWFDKQRPSTWPSHQMSRVSADDPCERGYHAGMWWAEGFHRGRIEKELFDRVAATTSAVGRPQRDRRTKALTNTNVQPRRDASPMEGNVSDAKGALGGVAETAVAVNAGRKAKYDLATSRDVVAGSDASRVLCDLAAKFPGDNSSLVQIVQRLNKVMTETRKALLLDQVPDAYWKGWIDRALGYEEIRSARRVRPADPRGVRPSDREGTMG